MIPLPKAVLAFVAAQEDLRQHFIKHGLNFTLDGKLVGDIGEALVAEAFGIKLCEKRTPGVDGIAKDGRTVQIKATGRNMSGPAFTPGDGKAAHLIFVHIDFRKGGATILYNGPEAPVRLLLPEKGWSGTKTLSLNRVIELDHEVDSAERLPRIA